MPTKVVRLVVVARPVARYPLQLRQELQREIFEIAPDLPVPGAIFFLLCRHGVLPDDVVELVDLKDR